MHGRVKCRTSEEQAIAKQKEQEQKLKVYLGVTGKIFEKRKLGEFDEEGLELTARILQKNPEFYTWWNYRREILLKLKPLKNEEEVKKLCLIEMDLTENCLKVSPKSYSTWHHRFWTMEFNPDPDWKRELKLCNYFLSNDDRNFHCWDYRRLLCKKCQVSPEEELAYSTELINTNFSNYSAWHYRSKLLPIVHGDKNACSIKEETRLKEFDLIQNAAFTDPDDQSVWFYHRWLLGRSNEPLHLLNVSILKPQNTVAVLLSHPQKIDNNCLKLLVNKTPVHVVWKPVSSLWPVPTVWLCDMPKSECISECEISVELSTNVGTNCLSCFTNEKKMYAWKNADRIDIFRSNLSAATQEAIENELVSCQQLNELEPDCKWTVFTCILLMRALNDEKYEKRITDFMDNLIKIDVKRENYYKDLKSKFCIEDTIRYLPIDATEVNLSQRNLTCLHHFDHFLLIEKIDLSSNELVSVGALAYLISVKCILIDNNKLENLEGIEDLKCLEILSAKNNLITSLKTIKKLVNCSKLHQLQLAGNAVTEEHDYPSVIKTLIH